MAKICKVCGDVGARCFCAVCSGRMHSACSTIQQKHRVCNNCDTFVKINPPRKRKHWWKCQKCGCTFERANKGEPRQCPQCLDKGYKSYRGISDRHPDLREKEGFDTPSNPRTLTRSSKKPDIEHIRKHWHASEDVVDLCMHAEGLENEVRRLNLFIRENVRCTCGVGGVPMCKRCMITDAEKKPAPPNAIGAFRFCSLCGMDLSENKGKHGAYCTFKAGQFAKK
jgi:hypothetical protein